MEEYSEAKVIVGKEAASFTLVRTGGCTVFLWFGQWSCFCPCLDEITVCSCFVFCLVQCSMRRFLSNRAIPRPRYECRASSWMSEVASLFVRSEGDRIGWREELNFDVVRAKASADPTESYGADMALQSCPTLRKGPIPYTCPSPQWAVIGCRLSQGVGGR